ncbi:MAG: helix-turn-helix domain-containing protein [Candidatus Aenigmatarchaeota archaeon]
MTIVSQKVMDALKSIGLNLYERKIWVALLSKGSASVGELAELSGVPRSRAYDILESLANQGFIVLQPTKPLKAIALPPEEALERAKKKMEENLKTQIERIEELKNSQIMKELTSLYKSGIKTISPEEIVGALKGESVFQQLETMFKFANKKISIVTTQEGLNNLLKNYFNILRKAKERGVEIKIVTTLGENKPKEELKTLSEIAEIKVINEKESSIKGEFAIVDGKEVLLNLVNPEKTTENIAIWTKSDHAASNLLGPLFDLMWERGRSI